MANRDAKLIERTLKDFSLGAMSGNGGCSSSGSNYVMTYMDYYQVVGKHVDVDSLIALLEKHNVNVDTEISPDDQEVIGIILEDSDYESIFFGYNVCSGGVEIRIFRTPLENLEVAYTFRNILTANKGKIESFVITKDSILNMISSSAYDNMIINRLGNYVGGKDFLTVEEALSIFK